MPSRRYSAQIKMALIMYPTLCGLSVDLVHDKNQRGKHSHEHHQETVMQIRVMESVKDRQQDQSEGTGNGEENRKTGTSLIEDARIRNQLASMSQPTL